MQFSPAIHGIPVLSGSSERNLLYPSPATDQRYQDRTTGFIYRYSGSTWETVGAGVNVETVHNVVAPQYGASFTASYVGQPGVSAGIQLAIDAARAAGGGIVAMPPGEGNLDVCLDLSDLGEIPITLRGAGLTQAVTGTTLRGNTGGCCIDTMGSQNLTLEGFRIYSNGTEPTPSRVGIIQGRTATNQYAQFQRFSRVMVFLSSIPGASARGTIGIYNVGAEHSIYEQVRSIADLPWAFATTDILSKPGPFGGAHSGPASMTLCDLQQTTAGSWVWYGYEFWDAQNIDLRHVYANRLAGSAVPAFNFNGACHGFKISGQVEEFPAVMNVNNDARGFEVDVTIVSPTAPYIQMPASVNLDAWRVRVLQLNGIIQNMFLAAAGCTFKAGTIALQSGQYITAANLQVVGSIIQSKSIGAVLTLAAGSQYVHLSDAGTTVAGALIGTQITPTEAVLVSGVDAALGNSAKVTLTAARLVGAPLHPVIGQRLTFTLVQDGTGAWAVTWNAVFKVSWSDTGNTANKRSSITFEYDGSAWNQTAAQTPYV